MVNVPKVHVVDERRDEELIADHLKGVAGAFDHIVARYAEDLFTFFQRFVGNAAAADDLVQETFLQVHLAASTFDPDRTFKPWLYTIAANKGRDYMRARGRRATQSLDAGTSDELDGPSLTDFLAAESNAADVEADAGERVELVRSTVEQMPEHLRLLLILGYYQRLPYAEIADILGVPVGTVKSRLHAAVGHFARLWLQRTNESKTEH